MITTKNVDAPVGGKGPSKKLEPGNQEVTIVGVKLQPNKFDKFKKDSDYLMLVLEGPDLGPNFEGFMKDKDDPSKGMHHGQVAWVKASEWAFADGTTKSGIEIKKDNEILRYIKSICLETDCMSWFDKQDGQHETIQSFVEQFDTDQPFAGKKLNVCISGRQYKNKEGYMNWDLFFPKFSNKEIPFESATVNPAASKICKFNENLHVKYAKEKEESSTTSAPANSAARGGDLDLD
jgi:hypothetical protein